MSEMGEMWAEIRQERQEKRANNREQSAAILSRAGIVFESKNLDAHLIVLAGSKTVDFWPGTGLWIVRGEKARRYGVRKLVAFVEQQRAAAPQGGKPGEDLNWQLREGDPIAPMGGKE